VSQIWDRIRAVWDNLSPRERLLLSAMGAMAAAVVVVASVMNLVLPAWDEAGTRVSSTEQQLETMLRLRRQYDEVSLRLGDVEERIRSNRDKRNILTLLESLAARAAVKIDSMEERQAADNEAYRETRVEVSLRSVTLSQTVKYLHNIETADRLFSIKGLRLKTRPDNAQLMDVSFTVSSFEPI
jgi:type II secretory pathway component PulM